VIPIPTKGIADLIERLFVGIPRERPVNKLWTIQRQLEIVRKLKLVRRDQELELAEMLLHGASLPDAVSEIQAKARERGRP
jgi:hypothetical protein